MQNSPRTNERPTSPIRRQRACAPCTKAKARCHFEDNKAEDGCDRCRRMNITCAAQTTQSLRRPRQVKPASTVPSKRGHGNPPMRGPNYGHVLLGAGPYGLQETDAGSNESTTSPSISSESQTSPSQNATSTSTIGDSYHAPLAQHNSSFRPQQLRPSFPAPRPLQPGFGLTWGQAEQAVSHFKLKFMPIFPFVVIEPEVSVHEILSKKPFLFRVIMLIAAQLTLAKQKEIRRSVLAYIGQHMLVMEERDMGLLQGLLVYIAWGERDFYFDQKITYLSYLAMGYAHNLAITRPPPTLQQKMMVTINPKDAKEAMMGVHLTTMLDESHTPEEQRAFLGCQYLLSLNSSQFGRDTVLKGDYVNHCLNSLVRPTDLGADFILYKMIRFQQIVEQISEVLPIPTSYSDGLAVFTLSMSNNMQAIRNQLDQLFANVGREHRQFVRFWSMHHYILVRLYLPASNLSQPPDAVAAQHQRQCMLFALQAARQFFATILSLGPEAFLYRTFVTYSEILFVLVGASRLLLIEIDGWDLNKARQMVDLPSTLENLIEIFKDVAKLRNQRAAEAAATFGVSMTPNTEEDELDDRFHHYNTKLTWIKNWFQAQLLKGIQAPGEPQTSDPSSTWTPENQVWTPFIFGFLGDPNWNIEF
ncbi:uncharacterized protein GGS22DRAFT_54773 [Annulohypoxylon maeteangense]|uniref:uncharacterized protein n=1 Tax=Annulohypoxylon maeteangense TaxID=1927788 RepID=UPI002007D764|nr:uncharacterized protein GGS22DRAFT_54773 [Annulohypoxylon maeteangense]KAI0881665.1 hypothetical protein GGS22DRAFT_54773 [Annulohypoxylon maeteangense]